jgi:yibE/F family protein
MTHAHLQGFGIVGDVKIQPSNGYEEDIGINMRLVQVAVFIVILIGGLIDTAVAICSGTYEIIRHNPNANRSEIIESGMNIGCKILSSNVNTLFFIFAGEFMIMCISFLKFYSWGTLINSKDFTQELIAIMISAIGTVVIIPISSYVASRFMFHRNVAD